MANDKLNLESGEAMPRGQLLIHYMTTRQIYLSQLMRLLRSLKMLVVISTHNITVLLQPVP